MSDTDAISVSSTYSTVDIGIPEAKVFDRDGKPRLQIWLGGVGNLALFMAPDAWRALADTVEAALKEAGL